jgi:NTE family protein
METKINKQQKIALVLSGGGFNCAFQLGAINYIQKNWKRITGLSSPMKFDIIAGVSGGALNGAFVAMNELPLLNDLWINLIGKKGVSEIYTSNLIDTSHKGDKMKLKIDLENLAKQFIPTIQTKLNLFQKMGLVFSKRKREAILQTLLKEVSKQIKVSLPKFKSIADNAPLKKKLEKHLDRNKIKGTEFISGFVSLDSGAYHNILHHQYDTNTDFINGILASTAMPLIWQPVESIYYQKGKGLEQSNNNVDGGIRNVSPLGDVIKLINKDSESDYKVIVINTNSGTPKSKDFTNKSIFDIAIRSLYEIAMTEVFNNDVSHFIKMNHLVKQGKRADKTIVFSNEKEEEIKEFEAVIISPDQDINLGNALVANESLIRHRIIHGGVMARNAFDKKQFNNG